MYHGTEQGYDGSGDEYTSTTYILSTSFEPYTIYELDQKLFSDKPKCFEWTFIRVFLSIYLVVVLLENIFSVCVIGSTKRRQGSSFIIKCIYIINVSHVFMTLQLLLYPYVFTWKDEISEKAMEDTLFSGFPDVLTQENYTLHPCQQSGSLPCRLSGFLFGVFLYMPLVAITLMSIDTGMVAFKWKTYRLRPHTASTIRLTLFSAFTFTILASFGLPALELGTHYHYQLLLKICWISPNPEDYKVQEFVYFIFGFGCFLVLLVVASGYSVFVATRAQKIPYKQAMGYQCSLMFGRFLIMKSKSWVSYSKLVLCLDSIAVFTYLPVTVGYIIQFRFMLLDVYWFNLVTEVTVSIIPALAPLVYIGLHAPHRKRMAEIVHGCSTNSNQNRITPMSISQSCSLDEKFLEKEESDAWLYDDMMEKGYEGYTYDRAEIKKQTPQQKPFQNMQSRNGFDRINRYEFVYELPYYRRRKMQAEALKLHEKKRDANLFRKRFMMPHFSPGFNGAQDQPYKNQETHVGVIQYRLPQPESVWRRVRNITSPFNFLQDKCSTSEGPHFSGQKEWNSKLNNDAEKRNVTFAKSTLKKVEVPRNYKDVDRFPIFYLDGQYSNSALNNQNHRNYSSLLPKTTKQVPHRTACIYSSDSSEDISLKSYEIYPTAEQSDLLRADHAHARPTGDNSFSDASRISDYYRDQDLNYVYAPMQRKYNNRYK